MCIIIDACVLGLYMDPNNADSAPVRKWLRSGRGRTVIGGKLSEEIGKVKAAAAHFLELRRRGIARVIPSEALDSEVSKITHQCKSNDAHMIALARIARARVLFTSDGPLMVDFLTTALVPSPQGKIYQQASHSHLLCHHKGCTPPAPPAALGGKRKGKHTRKRRS